MTALGVSVWAFGCILCVLGVMAIILEGRFMIRTTLALLANWLAHIAYFSVTADPTPYLFSIVVDLFTAVIILSRPAGRMQATIGWTLLAQIFVHFSYVLHIQIYGYLAGAEYRYWAWIDWLALGQLLLLGMWFGDGVAKHFFGGGYCRLVPWYRGPAKGHDLPGLAQP